MRGHTRPDRESTGVRSLIEHAGRRPLARTATGGTEWSQRKRLVIGGSPGGRDT